MDEHKRKIKRSQEAEQKAQQSERSGAEWSRVGVGGWSDGELSRWLLQRLSGGVDGQVVRWPRCSALPRRFTLPRRAEPPRLYGLYEPSGRSELPDSAFSSVGVVLGSGVVSRSPDDRRRCPVCHSALLSIGSRFFYNVRLPWRLCSFELKVVRFVDLTLSTNNCTRPAGLSSRDIVRGVTRGQPVYWPRRSRFAR